MTHYSKGRVALTTSKEWCEGLVRPARRPFLCELGAINLSDVNEFWFK